MIDLTVEKKVNVGLAIAGILLSIVGSIITASSMSAIMGGFMMEEDMMPALIGGSIGLMVAGSVLGLISTIFILIVYHQWASVLNTNIANTINIFEYLKQKDPDKAPEYDTFLKSLKGIRVPGWPYWLFFIFLLFYWFLFRVPGAFVFPILSVIFFLIHLHNVFFVADKLQELKSKAYLEFGNLPQGIQAIKTRNVLLVLLLTIVTFGIYWIYLIIKLSSEINSFIDVDKMARQAILSKVS